MCLDFRTTVFFLGTSSILATTALCLAGTLPISGSFLRIRYVLHYRATFFVAMFLYIYRILYSLKNVNRENVQTEIVRVTNSNGFQMTMFGFMMAFLQRPMLLSLFPVTSLAFFQWVTILNRTLSSSPEKKNWFHKVGFEMLFTQMQQNMQIVLTLVALVEILIFPVVIAEALSKKSFAKFFAYLFWLQRRYHSNDNTIFRIKYTVGNTGFYHAEAWRNLNAKFFSPVTRRISVLQKLSDGISTWFVSAR